MAVLKNKVNSLLFNAMLVSGLVAIITVPVLLLTLLSIGFSGTPLSMVVVALGSALLLFASFIGFLATNEPRPDGENESRTEGSKRHVYLVSGRGLIKIGISSCPDRRLRKHASQGLTQFHATHEFDSEWEARALEDEWIARITAVKGDILHDGFTEASFATTAAWTQAQEIWLEHTGKTVPIPFSRRAS